MVYPTFIVRISYAYCTYIVRILYVYRTQNSKYIVNTFVLTTSTFKRFIVSLSHAYRTFIVSILYVYRTLSQKKILYQIWLSKTRCTILRYYLFTRNLTCIGFALSYQFVEADHHSMHTIQETRS